MAVKYLNAVFGTPEVFIKSVFANSINIIKIMLIYKIKFIYKIKKY